MKENTLKKIPFFKPLINSDDKREISKALDSIYLTAGPKLEEFERKFAEKTGAKYAIGVSNATSALDISLKAIGIKHNDEVIVPDLTFVATASAVIMNNANPVLANVSNDLTISINSIKEKITKKTKAIIPVHFAGKSCNMKEIIRVAKENDLKIIEDCAHAIGTMFEKKHVGIFGNAGCFSFYPTKNITTIEGGMIITNSKDIAKFAKSYRNHGMTKSLQKRYSSGRPWEYDVIYPGYNYRLDEIRSSLGLSQLKRISKINTQRRNAARYYNSKLKKIKGIEVPEITNNDSCHLYIIKVSKDFPLTRDKLFDILLTKQIQCSVHYKPLHTFSMFKLSKNQKNYYVETESIYRKILSLPFYPQITKKEQDVVIKAINDIK